MGKRIAYLSRTINDCAKPVRQKMGRIPQARHPLLLRFSRNQNSDRSAPPLRDKICGKTTILRECPLPASLLLRCRTYLPLQRILSGKL
jgi:hypothetical protein